MKIMDYMMLVVNIVFLKYTKKILLRGRMLSVSQGNFIGSVAPYGFKKIVVKEGKNECHTLEPHPEQAPIVQLIFDMYVNKNMGRTNICHVLDDMGVKPPKGKRWSASYLKDLLANVHYIGKTKWNWRQTVEEVEDGQYIKRRPKSKLGEYLIFEGKHDGIVSEELFYAAEEKRGRNFRAKAKTKVRNPLAGLLFCRCGRAMSYRTYKDKDGNEKTPPRLLCDDQVHCGTGSCLYSEMIDRVTEILKQCIEDFELRIENNEGDSVKLHANLIKQLEKKMQDLEAKELSQWERQAHPDETMRMPEHIFKQLNAQLLEEKEETREAICKAYETMPEPVDYDEVALRFHAALDALKNPEADAALQNRLLKACIERIDYSREKPQRIKSQQTRYYDKELKQTRYKSPLKTGGNWTSPPIELDVKLRV
jgi:hypothetical protein